MLSAIASHEGQGKAWDAVWHDTDFYGAVCDALDPPSGDDGSSVDDDGLGSSEEEDEEEQDEYPAEMLDDGEGEA